MGATLSAKFTVIYLPNFPFTTIIWTFSFYDTFLSLYSHIFQIRITWLHSNVRFCMEDENQRRTWEYLRSLTRKDSSYGKALSDSLFVREGYRTQEEQQQLMDEKIEVYENEGKSKSEAKKLAEQWVAIPGTSEHQLGIAVDINADTTKSSSDDVYKWLEENAHTYGFIKRYPSNKTDITGVINEPWHYRYVGKEVASEIYSQGICLEEYIDTLD